MTTDYKVTELFCVIDKFYKHLTNRYFIVTIQLCYGIR